MRSGCARRCPRDRTVALVSAAAPPAVTGSLAGRQVFPRSQLVEPRYQPRAARSELRRLHQFRQRPHRSNTDRDAARCIRTSGPRRTASPTSSSPAISRWCGRRGRPTATRATRARRAARPAIRFRSKRRTQAGYIEGAVPGGGLDGDRHLLIVDRDNWLLYETGATLLERGGRTGGKRTAARSSIWTATRGGPRHGRRRTPRVSRSFRDSCATTKRSAPRRSRTRFA